MSPLTDNGDPQELPPSQPQEIAGDIVDTGTESSTNTRQATVRAISDVAILHAQPDMAQPEAGFLTRRRQRKLHQAEAELKRTQKIEGSRETRLNFIESRQAKKYRKWVERRTRKLGGSAPLSSSDSETPPDTSLSPGEAQLRAIGRALGESSSAFRDDNGAFYSSHNIHELLPRVAEERARSRKGPGMQDVKSGQGADSIDPEQEDHKFQKAERDAARERRRKRDAEREAREIEKAQWEREDHERKRAQRERRLNRDDKPQDMPTDAHVKVGRDETHEYDAPEIFPIIELAKEWELLDDDQIDTLLDTVNDTDKKFAGARKKEIEDSGLEGTLMEPRYAFVDDDEGGKKKIEIGKQLIREEWEQVREISRTSIAKNHLEKLKSDGKIDDYDEEMVGIIKDALDAAYIVKLNKERKSRSRK